MPMKKMTLGEVLNRLTASSKSFRWSCRQRPDMGPYAAMPSDRYEVQGVEKISLKDGMVRMMNPLSKGLVYRFVNFDVPIDTPVVVGREFVSFLEPKSFSTGFKGTLRTHRLSFYSKRVRQGSHRNVKPIDLKRFFEVK